MKTQETLAKNYSTEITVMYMAIELSNRSWKLALSDGKKMRYVGIDARKLYQLQNELEKARKVFGLEKDVKITSCYEAGRDGFWLHRYLLSCGIENRVVDSSSIEVSRRRRRPKTDRIDAKMLLVKLMRYNTGEKKIWSVVRVPSEQQEDDRQLGRELEVLKQERTMHINRIKGLLMQQGIKIASPIRKKFLNELNCALTWDRKKLGQDLKDRILREHERLQTVLQQIKGLKEAREERVERKDRPCLKQVSRLKMLRGIGPESSWDFVMEFFGWRDFKNRKEVAAMAGLSPTPYDSGQSQREQGISKAGNRRIRKLSVEIAWCWLRFQPQSKLSRWFQERFAQAGTRMRRIGLVALARRLLIALWRYLKYGIVPDGAIIKVEV
jgi:transposase